jgi:hypothetical protein
MPTPVACPLVPPGIGILNIITTKLKADIVAKSPKAPSSPKTSFTFLYAKYSKAASAAKSGAYTTGEIKPSGMCILLTFF